MVIGSLASQLSIPPTARCICSLSIPQRRGAALDGCFSLRPTTRFAPRAAGRHSSTPTSRTSARCMSTPVRATAQTDRYGSRTSAEPECESSAWSRGSKADILYSGTPRRRGSGSVAEEGTMYRHRADQQVVYGRFNDFLKTVEGLNAVAHKRGWPESRVWAPVVGTGNEAVLEADYSDLASFARANSAFQSDAEAMKLYRGLAEVIVQGSAHDELIEMITAPLA